MADPQEGDVVTIGTERSANPGEAASSGRLSDGMAPFMGMKSRRRASLHRVFKGDYLNLAANQSVLKLLSKQGDKAVLFADSIMKVNRHNCIVKRLLIITDAALYVLEPDSFRLKRRVPLQLLRGLCLSELNDNFFALIVPTEYDNLLASTRKTEIVTVLVDAVRKVSGGDLNVTFANSFEYSIDSEVKRLIEFREVDGGISSKITPIEIEDSETTE